MVVLGKNKIIQEVCKKEKVRYINVYGPLIKQRYNKLLDDGLHPNEKGYSEMFKVLKSKLGYWLK